MRKEKPCGTRFFSVVVRRRVPKGKAFRSASRKYAIGGFIPSGRPKKRALTLVVDALFSVC